MSIGKPILAAAEVASVKVKCDCHHYTVAGSYDLCRQASTMVLCQCSPMINNLGLDNTPLLGLQGKIVVHVYTEHSSSLSRWRDGNIRTRYGHPFRNGHADLRGQH